MRAQVEELLARYAERIDAGDFDGVGRLLGDAKVTTEGGHVVAEGPEQIAQLYVNTTKRHADGTPGTVHVITNLIVEPLGDDRFEARSCFTVFQATDAIPLQPVVAGRYRDTVERTPDGEIRFVERCMLPSLIGNTSDHLTFEYRP